MYLLESMMEVDIYYYLTLIKKLWLESDVAYVIYHNFARSKFDSYDSLSLEEIQTFHNVIILIKSVLNKVQNHYCYDIFSEKCPIN